MRLMVASLLALALLGASPSPSPSAAPRTVTVTCTVTPFYVFAPGSDRPQRAQTPGAVTGQRYGVIGEPRTTLEGFSYDETDVTIVEPGIQGHYWLSSDCVAPT